MFKIETKIVFELYLKLISLIRLWLVMVCENISVVSMQRVRRNAKSLIIIMHVKTVDSNA